METTAYIALSRQMALRQQMEIIANNVANMATTGFKAETILLDPVIAPAGARQRLAFVQDIATVRDVSGGPMIETGNRLDLAIEGPGYFVVETEAGLRYSRNGQFRLNGFGELVTQTDHPVLDDAGAPIALPPGTEGIVVGAGGTVSGPDGIVGRIAIVTFADEQRLRKVGDGLYETDQPAVPVPDAQIAQGMLEGSNVRPIVQMTEMMMTVRAYQGTQHLIDSHHDLQRRAIQTMLDAGG
jgi:flagellar basal-body rod protein FlgF